MGNFKKMEEWNEPLSYALESVPIASAKGRMHLFRCLHYIFKAILMLVFSKVYYDFIKASGFISVVHAHVQNCLTFGRILLTCLMHDDLSFCCQKVKSTK